MSRDARLIAVGLISFADDSGRFVATQGAVFGYVFPMDDDLTKRHFDKWMKEVCTPKPGESTPLVILYSHNGFRYGYFPKYRKHQRISHPQASPLPDPPQDALFEDIA